VTATDLASLSSQLRFGFDNRAGLDGTLNRISVMRDREDGIIGATLRLGE
jgi:hypothetical protein